MFIGIEGPDCCGKGTQTELLAQRLEAKRFKFPDKDTPIGALIYDHLFEKWHARPLDDSMAGKGEEINALMFQCMQLANRLEHACEIAETIHTLNQDVVADRYIASGIVYGSSDGLDRGYLKKVQDWLPQPDLNILIDIPLEVAKQRMKDRGDTQDRYENEGKLKQTIALYRQLWNERQELEGTDQWVVVNGNKSKVEVAADIIEAVKRLHARMVG